MQKGDSDVLSKLSENAKVSLKIALEISRSLGGKEVEPLHLFLGLIMNMKSLASRTIASMGVDIPKVVESLVKGGIKGVTISKANEAILLSSGSQGIIRSAYGIASKMSHVYVGSEHILLAILKDEKSKEAKLIYRLGLDYITVEEALLNFATYPAGILSNPEGVNPIPNEQSALNAFARDLVMDAKSGKLDPIIGREEEIDMILNILSRRKKNNPLIVGEAGVGKSALMDALAQRIADGNVPNSIRDCKLMQLDVPGIMAGSKMRGDVEEKMLAIVKEVTSSPNIILFIDEIHNILNSGIPGVQSDIVGILKSALTRGDFRCIGATTTVEYTRYMEEDDALVRRFQVVQIEEMSTQDTVKILRRIRPILENHHNVRIGRDVLEGTVRLAQRYVTDRYLPDKAIDLLDEAAATRKLSVEKEFSHISTLMAEMRAIQIEKETNIKKGLMKEALVLKDEENQIKKEIKKLEAKRSKSQKSREYEVDLDAIKIVVSKWTGIPITTLGGSEKSSLLNLNRTLSRKVVGQLEAVNAVANAIKRARTGISSEDRPWASFLFLGPTGVGKSELAKVLSATLFGSQDRLIQIDMSELMEMHSVSKLIGSPPGYVGYRDGGQLTERVRQKPHSVILFDEIEKAHPDVLNILLQILEYGHLTDGKGRKVSFKDTVVILTSNIGAEEIRKDKVLGFVRERISRKDRDGEEVAYESMKETLTKELKDALRPELINRLDDIVIFRALSITDAGKIVDLLINDLNIRLKSQGVKVTINSDVREYLAKEGYSEEYGARPLRRLIQDRVENVLAQYLLKTDRLNDSKAKLDEVSLVLSENDIMISS